MFEIRGIASVFQICHLWGIFTMAEDWKQKNSNFRTAYGLFKGLCWFPISTMHD